MNTLQTVVRQKFLQALGLHDCRGERIIKNTG